MKEEFFSKFKDYNNELEKILEKKDFSKDSKNLLLSMFYKLEISYQDYSTVKRKVKSKQQYLEDILENIKKCNKIEIIKPGTLEFEELKKDNKQYTVDLKLKKIKVIDNELSLLASILELNDFKIYLDEQYNLIRNAFPYLLNFANDINNTEVLRDFNAFSWNTQINDINEINVNLIYENLRIALSLDIIEKLENTNEIIDVVKIIKDNLQEQYNEKTCSDFLNLIFKLSIMIYIRKSEIEKKRLLDEKKILYEELKQIKDKKSYINNIINSKKEASKKVKEIDLILNNKKLLLEEYEKRNKELSNYHKIFSISHLTEKLQKERNRLISKINEYNKKLEPLQYVKDKEYIQAEYNLLKEIDFNKDSDNTKLFYEFLEKLQIIFIKEILAKKIEDSDTKEELINLVYQIRYYCFIPYTENLKISDVEKIRKELNIIFALIIKKLYQLNFINTVSTNERCDIEIVKNIFNLKMISLQELYIELIQDKENEYYTINLYDEKETIEKSLNINLDFNKKDKIKLRRKVKLF